MRFLLTNSGCFSPSAAFSWSNWEQYLLELIFGFLEGARNRGLPSNPTIYTTSPSLADNRPLAWLLVVHSACPMIAPIPHYCTATTFHRPSQFVLKMEHFCYVSVDFRESHVEIRSRRFFSLNLCGTQTSKRLTQPSCCK